MDAFQKTGTWELADLPSDKKSSSSRRVYRVKLNQDGSVNRYRARLVARGCAQTHRIDYEETFSPVARFDTIRATLSFAAREKLTIRQFDVTTAFLYGNLDENTELYMKQPPASTSEVDVYVN